MLKKLTALSLSLLFCLSLLPSRAYAMDTPKNEQPIKVEDMENLGSFSDADVGIAPCRVVIPDSSGGGGVDLDIPGNGKPIIGGKYGP